MTEGDPESEHRRADGASLMDQQKAQSLIRELSADSVSAAASSDEEQIQLSEYYRERLAQIAREGEIRAEQFATVFRFFFYGLLLLFSFLSWRGGRPLEEFLSQLGALSIVIAYNSTAFFLLRGDGHLYRPWMKYVSTFLEITTLSFLVAYLTVAQKNPTMPYTGAITLVYFIMLALSSIRNDRKVIMFALAVILVQYGAISFYFFPEVKALNDKLGKYTAELVPAMLEEKTEFGIVSIATMSLILKLLYMGATGFLVIYSLANSRRTANRQSGLIFRTEKELILKEKEKSDYLLLNILPEQVAHELKEEGRASPRHFERISVLFTDFKGFTNIAERLTPEELVEELDTCFRHFDEIIERYGLEKIKTIGDAYMCAGGLPRNNRTHAVDCVLAGLEIQNFMQEQKREKHAQGRMYWELRLGINTGDVVAGVVGKKKFAYDIWGDTVNTASRMESSGVPGHVNISEATYEEVKDFFVCQYRGEIAAKNKGQVRMYFVHGIRPSLSEDGRGVAPNDLFWRKVGLLKGIPAYRAS